MGISEVVERLAAALAAHVRRASLKDPVLVVYLAEISTMPLWRDMGCLDQWEERVQKHPIDREVRDNMHEPLSSLAEEIFELGRFNLYCAIQPGQTRDEFERVRSLLRKAGVSGLPDASEVDFSTW